MVMLFSEEDNKYKKEIKEILSNLGVSCSLTEKMNTKGIVIFLDNAENIADKGLSKSIVGICEDCNKTALKLFTNSDITVITCGMNPKNTITCSSINSGTYLISLQRNIFNLRGKEIEPQEFKVTLKKKYLPYSVMASVAVILLYGNIERLI